MWSFDKPEPMANSSEGELSKATRWMNAAFAEGKGLPRVHVIVKATNLAARTPMQTILTHLLAKTMAVALCQAAQVLDS